MTDVKTPLQAKGKLTWSLSFFFSFGLLTLLASQVDFDSMARLFRIDRIHWLSLAIISWGGTFWLRGLRYMILLRQDGRPDQLHCLHLSLMHHLYLIILPARAGEVVFPWLLKSITGLGRTLGLVILVILRLFDLALIFSFLSLGTLAITEHGVGEWYRTIALLVCILAFSIILLRFRRLLSLGMRVLDHFSRRRKGAGIFSRISDRLDEVDTLLAYKMEGKNWYFITLLSLGSWCTSAIGMWVLFWVFGQNLSLLEICFLLSGLNIVGLLGVFSIAGLGVSEAGLAGLLILMSIEPKLALALGVSVRLGIVISSLFTILLLESVIWLFFYPDLQTSTS